MKAITVKRFVKFGFKIFKDQDTKDYDPKFARYKKILQFFERLLK